MMQQISPLLALMKANCPPDKKNSKEVYGSAQLHENNSGDQTNMSVFFWSPINPSAPADEK